MAFLIGQCDNGSVPGYPGSGGTSGGGTGGTGSTYLGNESIAFSNVATLTVPWNSTRKARFGDSGVFYVELLMPDGKYRHADIEAIPDSITNTTKYDFDFGGPASGRITIA